jgi:hypothetical protein
MGVATGYAGWAAAYPVGFSSIEVYTVLCCNIAPELFSISRHFIYIGPPFVWTWIPFLLPSAQAEIQRES